MSRILDRAWLAVCCAGNLALDLLFGAEDEGSDYVSRTGPYS